MRLCFQRQDSHVALPLVPVTTREHDMRVLVGLPVCTLAAMHTGLPGRCKAKVWAKRKGGVMPPLVPVCCRKSSPGRVSWRYLRPPPDKPTSPRQLRHGSHRSGPMRSIIYVSVNPWVSTIEYRPYGQYPPVDIGSSTHFVREIHPYSDKNLR